MAPHSYRDSHGLVDLQKPAFRRGRRHDERDRQEPEAFRISEVKEKEHFFRSMGLRMKRVRCEDEMTEGCPRKSRKINIPSDVRVKKCSVVIQGASCGICGKCFKCKTDVDLHVGHRHGKGPDFGDGDAVKVKNALSKSGMCKPYDPFDYDVGLQNPKVLRLTFKIGGEVVTQVLLKRKHLQCAIETAAQTEFGVNSELGTAKDNYESHVVGIDSSALDNQLNEHCAPSIRTLNQANEYINDSAARTKNVESDENSAPSTNNVRSLDLSTPVKPFEKSSNEQRYVLHDLASNNLRLIGDVTQNKRLPSDKKDTGRKLPAGTGNAPAVDNQRTSATTPTNNSLLPDPTFPERTPEIPPSIYSTEDAVERRSTVGTNTPFQEILRASSRDLSDWQRDIPHQAENHQPQNLPRERSLEVMDTTQYEKSTESSVLSTSQIDERNSDDEIQEVLRITRGKGHKDSTEINHESPNRLERETLLWDAIRDMIRMEQQGYHLLESERRTNGDTRIDYDTGITNVTVERYSPRVRESHASEEATRVEITGEADPPCEPTGKLNITLEELSRYGINYYNDESDVVVIEE